MTQINITVTEEQLKELVYRYLQGLLKTEDIEPKDIKIEVKSKQNWKSEWEVAEFRATINKSI